MLRQTTKSQMEQSFDFAHRSNIERYKKLLQTYLTEHERAYPTERNTCGVGIFVGQVPLRPQSTCPLRGRLTPGGLFIFLADVRY